MLTRFEVSGFKNLHDVSVELGPFTCVAGPNSVGKSNLFDAIELLSLLSTHSFLEACALVRPTTQQRSDISALFSADVLDGQKDLRLAAEMILPPTSVDEFGQEVTPSRTFVRYELAISVRHDDAVPGGLSLNLSHEQLSPATSSRLHFPRAQSYISRFVRGRRQKDFLFTATGDRHYVSVRREEGSGRPREVSAERAQRTVLSATASAEYPTMLAARMEMSSWRFVALEPSAMRAPDDLMERRPISAAGAHVPASLFRQSLRDGREQAAVRGEDGVVAPVMDQVRDSLGSLVDVRSLRVVPDQARQTLELHAQVGETPELPARSLSDGTLRFIALSAMKVSPDYFGMLCMEEPENGIHPSKVIDMHALLSELSQPSEQAPRQVVVNTHSPYFVQATSNEDILCAVGKTLPGPGRTLLRGVGFHPLPGTWRAQDWQQRETARPVSRGEIAAFLENPADWDNDD